MPPLESEETSKHHPARAGIGWDIACLVIVGILVSLVMMTHDDYGLTWDEKIHFDYGDAVLDYFRSGGADTRALAHPDHHYGPGYDLLGAAVRRVSTLDPVRTMRLLGGMIGLLGMLGVWRLGRRLGGPRAGFLALTFIALTPAYYGQMFANPKDLPFAAAYVWAVYYLTRFSIAWPDPPWHLCVKVALALGAAMTVRVGGLVVVFYLFGIVLSRIALDSLRRERHGFRKYSGIALRAFVTAALAAAIMLAVWPWLRMDPLHRYGEALQSFSSTSTVSDTRLAGERLPPSGLPWSYLPQYFLLQLPEFLLLFTAAGFILMFGKVRNTADARFLPEIRRWFPAAAGLLPVAAVILGRIPVYDGLRQMLFVVPVTCAFAAVAAADLLDLRPRRVLISTGTLVTASLMILTLSRMISLHPYEYVHFNTFAGGHAGAETRYETDYYGLSFKQLCDELVEHLWRTERDNFLNHDYRVMGCVAPFFYEDQATPNFRTSGEHPPEFFVGYSRHDCIDSFSAFPAMVKVNRSGRTLSLARDLRGEP